MFNSPTAEISAALTHSVLYTCNSATNTNLSIHGPFTGIGGMGAPGAGALIKFLNRIHIAIILYILLLFDLSLRANVDTRAPVYQIIFLHHCLRLHCYAATAYLFKSAIGKHISSNSPLNALPHCYMYSVYVHSATGINLSSYSWLIALLCCYSVHTLCHWHWPQ